MRKLFCRRLLATLRRKTIGGPIGWLRVHRPATKFARRSLGSARGFAPGLFLLLYLALAIVPRLVPAPERPVSVTRAEQRALAPAPSSGHAARFSASLPLTAKQASGARAAYPPCEQAGGELKDLPPQPCQWSFAANVQPPVVCVPDPGAPWLQPPPKDNFRQLFDCQTGNPPVTVFYCYVAIIILVGGIQCAEAPGGAVASCTLNGGCPIDPCITFRDQPTLDPITGIPQPSTTPQPACPVMVPGECIGTFDEKSDWLFGEANGLLFAGSANATGPNTYGVPIIHNLWGVMVGIALALLALPFVMAGYQLMLGMASNNQAKAVESLGRVILVGIAIGMSFLILTWLIQLEDVLAQYLSANFRQNSYVAMPSSNWECYAHQFFGNLYNLSVNGMRRASWSGDPSKLATGSLDPTSYAQETASTTALLFRNLPNYVLTLLSVLLAIQLVVRLALINLHIILSPLTILCGAMPGKIGPSAARHWITGLASLIFVQILQLGVLLLGTHLLPPTGVAFDSGGAGIGGDWVGLLFSKLLPIVVMIAALNIPRLFNTSATTLLSTVTSSIGGAVSGVALIIRGL